ncbi:MAG: hypothetical protein IJ493_06390 [Clostridia bacterium]|nr:hypothetical protein [Clostridia bacterium]
MTRAEMKKIYKYAFLGVLIFFAAVGVIFLVGHILNLLKPDNQNLYTAPEPKQLLRIYAVVNEREGDEEDLLSSYEVSSMTKLEPYTTYRYGTPKKVQVSSKGTITVTGMPRLDPSSAVSIVTPSSNARIRLECDTGVIEITESYVNRYSTGTLDSEYKFTQDKFTYEHKNYELSLSVDHRIRYNFPLGTVRREDYNWRDVDMMKRYYNEKLDKIFPESPPAYYQQYRVVKVGHLVITVYDMNDPEKFLATATIQFRDYSPFGANMYGFDTEGESDMLKNELEDVNPLDYFAHSEIEIVHYEQTDVWEE